MKSTIAYMCPEPCQSGVNDLIVAITISKRTDESVQSTKIG